LPPSSAKYSCACSSSIRPALQSTFRKQRVDSLDAQADNGRQSPDSRSRAQVQPMTSVSPRGQVQFRYPEWNLGGYSAVYWDHTSALKRHQFAFERIFTTVGSAAPDGDYAPCCITHLAPVNTIRLNVSGLWYSHMTSNRKRLWYSHIDLTATSYRLLAPYSSVDYSAKRPLTQ
jgi:hypothetical protein